MISRDTAPRSRWPWSRPAIRARLELSQSCCSFREVVSERLAIIWLMLSFSSPTSPGASTVIIRARASWVTAAAPPGDTGDPGGEGRQLVHHLVDGVLQLQDLAPGVDRDVLRQVALGHRRGD